MNSVWWLTAVGSHEACPEKYDQVTTAKMYGRNPHLSKPAPVFKTFLPARLSWVPIRSRKTLLGIYWNIWHCILSSRYFCNLVKRHSWKKCPTNDIIIVWRENMNNVMMDHIRIVAGVAMERLLMAPEVLQLLRSIITLLMFSCETICWRKYRQL